MMFPSTTLALAAIAFIDVALAAPSAPEAMKPQASNDPSPAFSYSPSKVSQKTCEDPTFSPASKALTAADWRDCAALFSSWSSENGTFLVENTSKAVAILQSGSCALSVAGEEGPYAVGNVDVKDIMNGALKDFSDGNLLVAQGEIKCQVGELNSTASLKWEISNSDI